MQKAKTEFSKNKFTYLSLLVILAFGLFLRVYRTGEILGFYFDQGRDAMIVWNLLHKGDFFLIGPTTGIAGIFRGPIYYYLITPFYWLSRGDPVLPANFLSFTTIVASAIMFYLGLKAQNKTAGIVALVISVFSFRLIFASRWLSNPTPMLFLSTLLLLSMFMISEGKKWYWALLAFIAGLSLFHFGSSGEVFYFPALAIFAVWQTCLRRQGKHLPNLKMIAVSTLLFLLTIFPLILFDFRNGHLLLNNIRMFLFEKESFQTDFWVVLNDRLDFYKSTFQSLVFPSLDNTTNILLIAFALSFLLFLPSFLKNKKIKIVLLMLTAPIIGLLFFQGNEGNIYGYYLTGYYLIFVLLFAITAGKLWEAIPGKILVFALLLVFIIQNLPMTWKSLNDSIGPTTIVFKNQKQAIEWIYDNAKGQDFNVDVYVPPVIPHAYDYLFTWYPTTLRLGGAGSRLTEERIGLLYTMYEEDPPHPERLEAWKARQAGIGQIEEEQKFGGITVQRRSRIKYTD